MLDTSPVSGRDGGPASSWTRSQGRGGARPASEGRFNGSTLKLDGIIPPTLQQFKPFMQFGAILGVSSGYGRRIR